MFATLHNKHKFNWSGDWIFYQLDSKGREDTENVAFYLIIQNDKISSLEDECHGLEIISYELADRFAVVQFVRDGTKQTVLLERTALLRGRMQLVKGISDTRSGVPKDTQIIAPGNGLTSACIPRGLFWRKKYQQ